MIEPGKFLHQEREMRTVPVFAEFGGDVLLEIIHMGGVVGPEQIVLERMGESQIRMEIGVGGENHLAVEIVQPQIPVRKTLVAHAISQA
jgi:hypothetical protein